MFESLAHCGVTGRAIERGMVSLTLWNPRDYAENRHRSVDDRSYGGGPGMVMQVQPLCDAISAARAATGPARVIYLSPQGRRLDQTALRTWATEPGLVLVAGRYEGIDERVVELQIDEEWSIGDYVLSGGELAAMVVLDGIARLLPGVLGHGDSAQQDSFMDGLLDYPHYTRPEEIAGLRVPEVLLSGDHSMISRWRQKQALGRTWVRRPDLLEQEQVTLTKEQQQLLNEFIEEFEMARRGRI
jgi:tRNA (guanine37-N1)-methyltransferase